MWKWKRVWRSYNKRMPDIWWHQKRIWRSKWWLTTGIILLKSSGEKRMVDNIDEGENEKDTMVAGATDVIARLGVSPNRADCVVQTTWLKYIFAVLKHLLVFGKNIFHNFGRHRSSLIWLWSVRIVSWGRPQGDLGWPQSQNKHPNPLIWAGGFLFTCVQKEIFGQQKKAKKLL